MKHENFEQCSRCEDKYKGCHPDLVEWHRKVREKHLDCHVAVGWRDEADQETAFLQGLTNAHWPDSEHNKVDEYGFPHSHAMDLFRQDDYGRGYFEHSYYEDISKEAKLDNSPIVWGGDFRTFKKDDDHFQLTKES